VAVVAKVAVTQGSVTNVKARLVNHGDDEINLTQNFERPQIAQKKGRDLKITPFCSLLSYPAIIVLPAPSMR
jgi:hypothetical protein